MPGMRKCVHSSKQARFTSPMLFFPLVYMPNMASHIALKLSVCVTVLSVLYSFLPVYRECVPFSCWSSPGRRNGWVALLFRLSVSHIQLKGERSWWWDTQAINPHVSVKASHSIHVLCSQIEWTPLFRFGYRCRSCRYHGPLHMTPYPLLSTS